MESHDRPLHRALRIFAFAVWFGIILYALIRRKDFTLEAVLRYTPKQPLLAALVMQLLFALKSLTIVFYSGVLYAASGIMFSLPVAIAVNLCGTVVMALISYCLARSLGASFADEMREKHPKLKEFEAMRSRNSFAFVVVLRCVNIVNFDIGSMYCGAVRMPFAPFLAGSLLGKITDIVILSVMGASLESRNSVPFLIALAVDLAIAAVITLWSKKHNVKEAEKHE